MKVVTLITSMLLLTGCNPTNLSNQSPTVDLREYRKIFVRLVYQSDQVFLTTDRYGNIFNRTLQEDPVKNPDLGLGINVIKTDQEEIPQWVLRKFLNSFRSEMAVLGSGPVESLDQADVIVDLSIGRVRYDRLDGWIADYASAQFKDPQTEKVIASYKVNPSFNTPTLETLAMSLAGVIAKK